ncbi:MAG: hypothetical protein AB7U20_06000 [Planctomycetaceae bacterium]
MRRRALSRFPFHVLQLLQQGQTLGSAIESAVRADGEDQSGWGAQLQEWFRLWTQDGYFAGADV